MSEKEKITGFRIMEAIKELEMRRGILYDKFQDSIMKFKDEKKEGPIAVSIKIEKIEERITELQALQAEYNTKVKVKVQDKEMTLMDAVRRLGGANRISQKWKEAAGKKKHQRSYMYDSDVKTRDNDKEYAEPALTSDEALAEALRSEKYSAALKAAIAEGNTTIIALHFEKHLLEAV